MAIDLTKVPLLSHVQYLYGDLRDRIKEKYSKPEEGIPASDLAPGVIPDIGLIENEKAPIIMETASGNPIVITDGSAGLPLSECKLTLLPRQSGSGDASPENIRPLIPWENVGTWQACINVWDEEVELGGINSSTGIEYSSTTAIRAKNYIPVVPGASYYMTSPTSSCTGCWYDKDKNYISTRYITNQVMTAPSNAYFFRFDLPSSYGTTYNHDISINYPSTDTEYHPYTGQSYPVDLSSITPAVYGCEIHLTTGEVWGTHVLWTKNTASMNNTADYPGWTNAGIRDIVGIGKNELVNTVLNIGDVLAVNTNNVNDIVYLPKTTYSLTQDEWITLAIDVQIALPLATPVLLATLTPQEIETLLGTNTIWSDADSIDIEYRADTELFINQNGVKDVQVNGTSVATNGVANVPVAGSNNLGVARVKTAYGLQMTDTNNETIAVQMASGSELKSATNYYKPVVPASIHQATFYGLAKASGDTTQSQSSNAVGTYTDAAKQGIQKMLGLDGLVGPYEADITADRAYTIGEAFVMDGKRYKATAAIAQGGIITPGTNCELDPLDGRYVRNTDYASAQKAGLVKTGVGIALEAGTGKIYLDNASKAQIKGGTATNIAIPPFRQHVSVFYGLSKLAGVDLASGSDVVGTYPQNAKDAIQSMLGIEADIPLVETVSGTTPSITGMPNVRYICGEVSLLTITPPASGSIVVRFSSGSTATVLTVPNTVKFPAWFDPTDLEANTTYELIITDGVYGGAMAWAD